MSELSIVIPAYNEEHGIADTVQRVRASMNAHGISHEIIVVDDGSTDATGTIAQQAGATVIRNPVNGGYGLSLQRGIRAAKYANVALTDADGTYPVEQLPELLAMVEHGLDMAVGTRTGAEMRRGRWKHPARILFRIIAEFVAGRKIPDINSGLRVMRRDSVLPYLPQTCLGFSFTTSITLILMLTGQFVDYRDIPYAPRIGSSKVRHFRDTLRTGQIMTSIIAAYNPIKLAIILMIVTFIAALILSIFSHLVAAVLIGTLPIVFMLGCLGEMLRRS